MWIKELDIVSFGKWNRKKIYLNQGMNYFQGPNEAGKSSIRMFMTYILFGLKADERERYTSKIDGQLGGRLVIEKDGQDWIIERFAHQNRGHRVGYLDGEQLAEQEINHLLKGIDRFLFESIFSFQDRDLQAIRKYKPEDIGRVLFNLGLTGSDKIMNLENQLTKHADDLFKKQGKKPPLNEKLSELKKLTQEIEQVEQKEQAHQKLYQDVLSLNDEIEELKEAREELSTHTKYLEKLLQSKSSIVRYQMLSHDLQNLNRAKNFPADGLQRFEQLREKRRSFNEKIHFIDSNIKQIEDGITELKEKSQLNKWSMDLSEAQRFVKQAIELKNQLSELNEQRKDFNREYMQIIKDLGLKMSHKEITEIPINSYTNENWKRIARQWEDFINQEKTLSRKLKSKENELTEEFNKKQKIINQMINEQDVISLKERQEELKLSEQKRDLEKQFVQQISQQKSSLEKLERFIGSIKLFLPTSIFFVAVLYFLTIFSGTWIDYGAISITILGSVTLYYVLNQQQKKLKASLNESKQNQEISEQGQQQELFEVRKLLNQYEQQKDQLNIVLTNIQSIQTNLEELSQEQDYIKEQIQQIESDIEQEINKFTFLSNFELYYWPNVYENLQRAKRNAESILNIEEKMNQNQARIDDYKVKAHQLIQYYEPGQTFSNSEVFWNAILEKIELEKEWQKEIKQKQEWLEEKKNEKEQYEAAHEPYDEELQGLLSMVEADSEESFIKLAEEYQEYHEKKKQLKDSYTMVYEVFGDDTDKVFQLNYNWPDLEEKVQRNHEKLMEIENDIDSKRYLRSEMKADIKQLEENGILSELIHNRASLEAEIIELAKEWAIIKTANGYLKDTKSRYQNVYLPDIMEQTRNYFSVLTNGRYNDLYFSGDEETVIAQTEQGNWFNINQISEGTADQLYVSLRLALNDSLKKVINVPFVLDDAFVHFDENRRAQVIEQLSQITKEQQIIYLTCDSRDEKLIHENQTHLYVS